MQKVILPLLVIVGLLLASCTLFRVRVPELPALEVATRTRLIFPMEGDTKTPTVTLTRTITPTPTKTPIGWISPTPTNTLVPIFPLEPTEAFKICVDRPAAIVTVQGIVWLDVNANGLRDSGESGIPGIAVDIGHSESAVRTGDNGRYKLPVGPNDWPVMVRLDKRFFTFDVHTPDSSIVKTKDEVGFICAGSSYDVGLTAVSDVNRPAGTNTPTQNGGTNPPPSCSQEPNNPSCVP